MSPETKYTVWLATRPQRGMLGDQELLPPLNRSHNTAKQTSYGAGKGTEWRDKRGSRFAQSGGSSLFVTKPVASFAIFASSLPWVMHLREILLWVSIYLAYIYSPTLLYSDHPGIALENARLVISFEQSLGIFWEPIWQGWAIDTARGLILFFNWAYIVTFWPIIALASVILYVSNRDRYGYYRNVRLFSVALALLVYVLFPLAPPRMVEDHFVDTIRIFGPSGYGGEAFGSYYNAYAAMPSLHFGWTVLFGVMFLRTPVWWIRAFGVVYPTLMLLSITITGNHYIVDAVGGALVIGASFLAAELCNHHRVFPSVLATRTRQHWRRLRMYSAARSRHQNR